MFNLDGKNLSLGAISAASAAAAFAEGAAIAESLGASWIAPVWLAISLVGLLFSGTLGDPKSPLGSASDAVRRAKGGSALVVFGVAVFGLVACGGGSVTAPQHHETVVSYEDGGSLDLASRWSACASESACAYLDLFVLYLHRENLTLCLELPDFSLGPICHQVQLSEDGEGEADATEGDE